MWINVKSKTNAITECQLTSRLHQTPLIHTFLPAGMVSVEIRQWRLPKPLMQVCLTVLVKTFQPIYPVPRCCFVSRHVVMLLTFSSVILPISHQGLFLSCMYAVLLGMMLLWISSQIYYQHGSLFQFQRTVFSVAGSNCNNGRIGFIRFRIQEVRASYTVENIYIYINKKKCFKTIGFAGVKHWTSTCYLENVLLSNMNYAS